MGALEALGTAAKVVGIGGLIGAGTAGIISNASSSHSGGPGRAHFVLVPVSETCDETDRPEQ